jgi:hypothetical protein
MPDEYGSVRANEVGGAANDTRFAAQQFKGAEQSVVLSFNWDTTTDTDEETSAPGSELDSPEQARKGVARALAASLAGSLIQYERDLSEDERKLAAREARELAEVQPARGLMGVLGGAAKERKAISEKIDGYRAVSLSKRAKEKTHRDAAIKSWSASGRPTQARWAEGHFLNGEFAQP